MQVAIINFRRADLRYLPWLVYRERLAEDGFEITFGSTMQEWEEIFSKQYDVMMIYVWLDWNNIKNFHPSMTMRILSMYSAYRAKFDSVVHITCNHTDWCRDPKFSLPYWRKGDPVLYRTPAYNRDELLPYPKERIWPYEKCSWVTGCLKTETDADMAAFVGRPSGPQGYRERVAAAVAEVGIGRCSAEFIRHDFYCQMVKDCVIQVCPRGWGENSRRHWEAWLSRKVVFTDVDCDSVEMIPGIRLKNGEHYVVYNSPEEIPDLVSDWLKPGRRYDLERIRHQGWLAALSYNPYENILKFFREAIPGA